MCDQFLEEQDKDVEREIAFDLEVEYQTFLKLVAQWDAPLSREDYWALMGRLQSHVKTSFADSKRKWRWRRERGVYPRNGRSVLARRACELRRVQERDKSAASRVRNPMDEELLDPLLSLLADVTAELVEQAYIEYCPKRKATHLLNQEAAA
jgi:hypothetical protein